MVKNPPSNAGDMDSIPGLGRYPGGAWQGYSQWGCKDLDTTEQLSTRKYIGI